MRGCVLSCVLLACLVTGCCSSERKKRDDGEDSMDNALEDENHPNYIFANWNYTEHKFAELVEGMMKKMIPQVIRSSSSVELSGPCMAALFKMMLAIRQGKLWAYSMMDSWGKPGGGMLVGTLASVGDYDECVDTVIPDLKDTEGNPQRGMYCLTTFAPILPPKPKLYTLFHKIKELENITKKDTSFAKSADQAQWFYLMQLRMGVCMPSACTSEDVYNIIAEIPKKMSVKGITKVLNCETKQALVIEKEHIAVLSVLGVIAFLLIIGTTLDVVTSIRRGDDPEPPSITKKLPYRLCVCFSAYTNLRKLFNTDSTSNSHLGVVSGIRFITITWVIVGHTYLYADYNMMRQSNKLQLLPPNFAFQVIANAMSAVDTYIMMSAMLVTYGILKSQEKRKGINIFMYVFHRFWRLTPTYMIVIALLIATPLIGSGPLWKFTLTPYVQNCKNNWWTNLLYVNNYVNAFENCLEHTWYLAVDMQLHILGLIVLLPLIRWPKLAAVLAVLLTGGAMAIAAMVNIVNGFPPGPLGLYPDPDDRFYVAIPMYFKPYAHVGPYFVGVALGYLIVKKPKLRIPRGVRVLGWFCASALNITVIYGAYPWNNGNLPGPVVSAIYAATAKTAWAFGIFWVIMVCATGNGGIVNKFLSWKAWVPLSRLSFAAYLIHPLVIWVHNAYAHNRTYTSHFYWVYNLMGHFMFSMALSLALSLSIEGPFLALEKIVFGAGGREKSSRSDPQNTKMPELPSYNSEMKTRTYSKGNESIHNMYRNGGDGLYRTPAHENGNVPRNGVDNGVFCHL